MGGPFCRGCAAKLLLVPEPREQEEEEEGASTERRRGNLRAVSSTDSSPEIPIRQSQTGTRSQVPNTSKTRLSVGQEADRDRSSRPSLLHPATSVPMQSNHMSSQRCVKYKSCVSDDMLIREKGARLAVLPRSLITQVLTMAHQTGKWVKFTV